MGFFAIGVVITVTTFGYFSGATQAQQPERQVQQLPAQIPAELRALLNSPEQPVDSKITAVSPYDVRICCPPLSPKLIGKPLKEVATGGISDPFSFQLGGPDLANITNIYDGYFKYLNTICPSAKQMRVYWVVRELSTPANQTPKYCMEGKIVGYSYLQFPGTHLLALMGPLSINKWYGISMYVVPESGNCTKQCRLRMCISYIKRITPGFKTAPGSNIPPSISTFVDSQGAVILERDSVSGKILRESKPMEGDSQASANIDAACDSCKQ